MTSNELFDFLAAEGLTYAGALNELADKIAALIKDGSGDSLPRALELTRSLERLLSIWIEA